MGACQGCDEWQTILVSAYRIGNFPCGACASPAPPGLKGTCLTASLLPRTNHALQKTAWECPEGCVPVPTQHQPQQQPPQQPQQNQHQQYYNAWGQAQQPNHWQQPAWGQNMFGQQPAWGQHGAQLHQRQGFGGVQQNTGQTATGQHPGWGGYQQQGAQHGGPHHGAHGGQPPQHGAQAPATRAGTAPTANAFAWKAPKNKPEPLSKESTFEWDDGRRDHDFPPLGAGDGQSSGCNTPSYSRFGESKPNSPYQATPYSNYSSNGGYLGRSQAHHHQANQAPPTDKWPPKLQTFVEKAFKQCNTAHERTCMHERACRRGQCCTASTCVQGTCGSPVCSHTVCHGIKLLCNLNITCELVVPCVDPTKFSKYLCAHVNERASIRALVRACKYGRKAVKLAHGSIFRDHTVRAAAVR